LSWEILLITQGLWRISTEF